MNGTDVLWDHWTRHVRDDDREAFSLLKPGMRYSELPKRLRRYRSDIFNDKYHRLAWDDLCRSITAHIAKDGYWYIHPSEQRTLTVREAARVQTFPDRFRFAGTRTHAFRQIGNAVPPALGEAIGRELLRGALRKRLPPSRRPGARLAWVRRKLLEWSRLDAKQAPWRHPGDPWAVLASVVLGDRVGAGDERVRAFLEAFPAPGRGVSTAIRKMALRQTANNSLERMASAAQALASCRRSWESDSWVEAADLGAAEEAFVRVVGLEEDRVLVSATNLRVVGRVMGRASEVERRGSAGRMLLGRVLGCGGEVPALTASLQALGRSTCSVSAPNCRRCPLRSVCEAAE